MRIRLYRGAEFYREVDASPGYFSYKLCHRQPLTLMDMEGLSEFAMMNLCDAIETFVLDVPTGHYVSTDLLSLPAWVIRQEMEQARRDDERKRLDTFARMFA